MPQYRSVVALIRQVAVSCSGAWDEDCCDGVNWVLVVGGSGISLPSSWSPMKQTDQFIAVPVAAQTTEYNTVQQHFTATAQSGYSTIVKVH